MHNVNGGVDPDALNRITSFINEIGIMCVSGAIPEQTFLPGISIQNGAIIYNAEKMLSPGDLLHEAGHLAVLQPEHRQNSDLYGDMSPAGMELAAIAWSWAAKEYLQIAPEILFHEDGYRGDAGMMIDNFTNGKYVGAPLLSYIGLTREPKPGIVPDENTYPKLKHWLRRKGEN